MAGVPLTAVASEFSRPHLTNGPTEVNISIYVLDIDEINNVSQSFDANVFIQLIWMDPRLAHLHPEPVIRNLNEVWNPRVQFINQQKIWQTLPEIVEILPDGQVIYRQRVWGSFSQPLELRDFPFDNQTLNIQLVSAAYNTQEILFISSATSKSGIAPKFSMVDWNIVDWKVNSTPFNIGSGIEDVTAFSLSINVDRKFDYFTIKVILPLILIIMMSWVVFWIDPTESGSQIGVAVTSMLTLIAYRFAVAGDLPKVSYLTRLDYFILCATFLVFASLIEVVITSDMTRKGNINRARTIDRWSRILFPMLLCIIAYETLVLRVLN
jgi:hypothetical protein